MRESGSYRLVTSAMVGKHMNTQEGHLRAILCLYVPANVLKAQFRVN
jgi:hypothetical protein